MIIGRKIAVFDMDGTLTDDSERAHLKPTEKIDQCTSWQLYNCKCKQDKPKPWVVDMLIGMQQDQSMTPVIVTSRPFIYRVETFDWLRDHGIDPTSLPIFMRFERSDFNPVNSIQFKMNILVNLWQAGVNEICVALDDREDIIEAYRELIPNLCKQTILVK